VRTSKVRHSPVDRVSARAGTALERAQPAQIELFARKKSRRFIIRLEIVTNNDWVGDQRPIQIRQIQLKMRNRWSTLSLRLQGT
jgi:hypothetical protein